MEREELRALRAAVRGALARPWPAATTAGVAAPPWDDVWAIAIELGWTDLGGSLDALLVVAEELGRVACPLPVAETDAVTALFHADADAGIRDAVAEGRLRVTAGDSVDALVEAGDSATHLLALDGDAASLLPITGATAVAGLAIPALSRVEVGDAIATCTGPAVAAVRRRLRGALVARAMGAARRGHELAVEHASVRMQFGRPIGSFQAVSHRLADAAVDLAGWDALVGAIGTDERTLEGAIEHGSLAAVRITRAAQRTLAASGYFEEHELPWLFRRAHADLARERSLRSPGDDLASLILANGLPGLEFDDEAEAQARTLERVLDDLGVHESTDFDDDPAVLEALGQQGWITPGLPSSAGGRGADVPAQMAIDAVMHRRRVPVRVTRGIAATLAGAIDAHGSAEQRETFLSLMASGRFRCYLGYSEPDVGSDLASLRTTARRDGDEWVVDGIKLWGTGAHHADYVWLAARTNPDEPRHKGITVFLAPTRLPGWTVTEHRALSGEVSCTTVFDGVRIPDSCRVGPVHGGWAIITSALAAERVVMAGLAAEVGRQFDDLVDALRRQGTDTGGRLASLGARLQVARALVSACGRDETLWLEAAMAKLVTSELAEDVALAAMDLLGLEATAGPFDHALRLAPMYVIGGGTADIQRNLIARGVGLPR